MLAEIIQRVRPSVILLNEIDHDAAGESVTLFCDRYLAVSQNGQPPIDYEFRYTAAVNTGVDSGLDLDGNGQTGTAADAFGFGNFPGQYGMAVLSEFPIRQNAVRSFRKFLWRDMPGALRPVDPQTGKSFYPDEIWNRLRLSSKSVWDVPIQINGQTLHLICSHPTPPVFDGPEDRNGCRNHDEIRMVADYVGGQADYLTDDAAGRSGGLPEGGLFVVAGDMNADPWDGDSRTAAARQLTDHPALGHAKTPASRGAVEASRSSGQANNRHQADPAHDTADFDDRTAGNLRVDYCLPCASMEMVDGGVYWPAADEPGYPLNRASDHHLVWIDVMVAPAAPPAGH